MQLLVEFFPILLFFIAYKISGIYIATIIAIIASSIQIIYNKIYHHRWNALQLSTFFIVLLLGGATIWLQNPIFIKLKPTVVYGLFGLIFLGSQFKFISKKTVLEYLIDKKMTAPKYIWQRVNFSWVIFFFFISLLNIYMAYHVSTNAWVNFKLFGVLGCTLLFSVAQSIYLARHATINNNSELA
jgi:intracellular septation protein